MKVLVQLIASSCMSVLQLLVAGSIPFMMELVLLGANDDLQQTCLRHVESSYPIPFAVSRRLTEASNLTSPC